MHSTNDYKIISVIIPAYNVEEYLERTLKSVREQSYRDLEIIIVDDGSTDSTGRIADRAAEEDKRIRVIHQENGGVSKARNTGLDAVTGDLIAFVDSDDHCRENMLEILYADMEETGAELVVCAHEEGPETFSGKISEKTELKEYMDTEKFMMLFNEHKDESVVLWGKLYKRELFEGLRFPEGKIHEDEYLAHYILERSGLVTYDPRAMYYYYKRPVSITTDHFSKKRLDCIPALTDRISFFEKQGKDILLHGAYVDFLKRFQYYYYGIKHHYPEDRKSYEELFSMYGDYYRRSYGLLSLLEKLRFGLFIYFPGLNYHIKRAFGAKNLDT